MTFRIPSDDRRLSQPNNSDVNGNLYKTRNIDLDEEGYIKLAHATVSLYSTSDNAQFNNINSITVGSDVFMFGTAPFASDLLEPAKSSITNLSTDSNYPENQDEGDGVYFNGAQVATDDNADEVRYKSGTTWIDITTTSGTSGSVLAVFPAQNSLLYGRGNLVKRINTSWAVAQTLTLPSSYNVTSMEVVGNYVYIATKHEQEGDAVLFVWTGINTTNDGSYGVGSHTIQTIKKYGGSVVAVDGLGRLLLFNGSGFDQLAAFPPYYTDVSWGTASADYTFIKNRGMIVDGELIFFVISHNMSGLNKEFLPTLIGDVWCYDPKVGLYQRYSSTSTVFLADEDVDAADINTSTDTITVSGITVPATGSPVYYPNLSSTPIGGLPERHWYYTIKVTDTTFKLAKTYKDAILGTSINLTSATDNNKFYFVSQKDYGLGISVDSGAIFGLESNSIDRYSLGKLIFTSQAQGTGASPSSMWRLMATSALIRNFGYFVTPKMFAEANQDVFKSIVLRFKPLKYGDKITIKYKTSEKTTFPAMPRSRTVEDNEVTWTSATTFTTVATPDSNWYDFSQVEIGDEVEIIGGSGSGFISTVSAISVSGFQYTVTIADNNPFVTANDTSLVMIDNWKTLEVIDGATFFGQEKTISVGVNSAWIQFKICMEGTDVTLYDSIVNNSSYERP